MTHSAAALPSRLAWGLLFALVALLFVTCVAPSSARGQEPEPPAVEPPPEEPGEVKKADDRPNMIAHMIRSVGWVFGPLLLFVSVTLIAIIVLLSMDLRMQAAVPPGFVEDFTDIVNKRQFKQAYDLARNDGSFLGRVLTTGMARLQYGIEDAREASFNMVDSIRASKEQLISYLGTIGTLGPLLGLVGTVYGMIEAFMVLGRDDPGQKDIKLAQAISHALVVTLFGVALSVPAIFCHTFFRNRLIRLSMDTGNVADDLLTQMYHNTKKGPTPGGAPETAAATDSRGGSVQPAGIKPK